MDLNDLASFVRVVELGTISAAAEAEGVPKSTISRRIARLEETLGVELLRRSARSFALTDDAMLLHRRAAGALQELTDVRASLVHASAAPRGMLTITAPHGLARLDAISELLIAYRARCPHVAIELRLEDRVVDLIAEGVDVALRAHVGDVPGGSGLMTRPLTSLRGGLYASPAYLARRGTPQLPSELSAHDVLLHTLSAARDLVLTWGSQQHPVTIGTPVLKVNDFGLAQRLVESGMGVGLLPEFEAVRAVHEGRLVRVLDAWTMRAGQLSLVWPASRHLHSRVRAFLDLASEHLRADRPWPQAAE